MKTGRTEERKAWECARPFPQSSKNGKGSATPDYIKAGEAHKGVGVEVEP